MGTARPLDDITILRRIVEHDDDLWITAIWTHVLKDALDANEIAFPIESRGDLAGLLERGRETNYPPPAPQGKSIPMPDLDLIPDQVFPCHDLTDFVRKLPIVIVACRKAHFKLK